MKAKICGFDVEADRSFFEVLFSKKEEENEVVRLPVRVKRAKFNLSRTCRICRKPLPKHKQLLCGDRACSKRYRHKYNKRYYKKNRLRRIKWRFVKGKEI